MEKPSANQSGGTAQNLDWVNLQQTKIPKCVLSSAFIAESYITRKNFFLSQYQARKLNQSGDMPTGMGIAKRSSPNNTSYKYFCSAKFQNSPVMPKF